MGQQASQLQLPALSCCTERLDPTKGVSPTSPTVSRNVNASGTPIPDIAARFDAAVRNKDLAELVRLLSSNHKLGSDVVATQHPWAEQPQTIGALAAVHIAVLANDPGLRTRLRAAGAIPVLVQFLNASNTSDKVHSAVVALSFITIENDDNCQEVYRAGGMPLLVPLISARPVGLGFASLSVCRNVYCKNRNAREEFSNLGGIKATVGLLTYNSARASDSAFMDGIFETVSNLSDLVQPDATTGDSGGRIGKRAVKEGIVVALTRIHEECDDEEIKQEAKELNTKITKFINSSVAREG